MAVRPDLPDPLTVDPLAPLPPDFADRPVVPVVSRGGIARRFLRVPVLPLAVAVVALLTGGALFLSGYSMGRQAAAEPGTSIGRDEAFRPFWDTYHTITERYAGGEVDRGALVQGAVKGMIESLGDPYSSYLSSTQYRDSLQSIGGQFEGIGAQISSRAVDGAEGCTPLGLSCRLLIVAPMNGSPAKAADLRAGDLVLAIDGVSLDGLTVDEARGRIRGPKGSLVTLTVKRGSQDDLAVRITRDVIQQEEVVSRVLAEERVGYVRLNGFSDRSAREIRDALAAHVAGGRTRLILDLRGDPGGYVTAARDIASQFIGSGVIFWEQDAAGTQTPTDALPGGVATDPAIKVVCLIDGGSASASEIVAGALRDRGRALLVGQRSFGKGTVQQWQELTGEGGAFRLTVARWLTPDKRWIHGVGLEPDVTVAVSSGSGASAADPTLERAVEVLLGEGLVFDRGWHEAA